MRIKRDYFRVFAIDARARDEKFMLEKLWKLYASKALKNTIDEAKIKSVRSVYK